MQYCSHCGARVIDSAKFCTECGTKLKRPEPPNPSPLPETKRRKKPGCLLSVLVVVLLLIVLFRGCGNDTASEPATYKAVTMISGGQILDEELMELIGGCYLRFHGDGTGTFYCFGDRIALTYDDKVMTVDGATMPYTVKGKTLEFTYVDGSGFTMERTQEDPEQADADNGWAH